MANHVYRLQMGWVASNKNFGLNTFAYEFDDSSYPNPFEAAADLVQAFIGGIIPTFKTLVGTDLTINLCSAKRITGGGGPSAAIAVNVAGTGGGLSVSTAFAACIKWVNADPDNRMGRTFIGGVPDGKLVSDVFIPGYVLSVASLILTMVNPLLLSVVSATFGKYDKKTSSFWPNTTGQLNPKASGFNRRTLPVT